jgi:hypothetical protein
MFLVRFGSWFDEKWTSWAGLSSCLEKIQDFMVPDRFLVKLVSIVPYLNFPTSSWDNETFNLIYNMMLDQVTYRTLSIHRRQKEEDR